MSKIRTLVFDRSIGVRALAASAWLLLHFYAGRPLLTFAGHVGIAPVAAWMALVFCAILSVVPFRISRSTGLTWRTVANWSGYASMSFFAVLLTLVLFGDVIRSIFWLGSWAIALTLGSSRAMLDGTLLNLVTLGAGTSLALVGAVQARRPRIRRVKIPVRELPPELEGYRIVQLSDVHVGPTIQGGFVGSLVKRVNRLRPDAVAITGDLVDAYVDEVGEEVLPLADLRTRDGVFYVTGNHEYYWRFSEWAKVLVPLGLVLLKNESRTIRRGDAQLTFAGVTDPVGRYAHKQDLDAALDGIPADSVKVLLSHRPQMAKAAAKRGVDVQLSGHTHGGQFFPFNLFIRYFQPIVAGLHEMGGLQLYVSRGTGYWGPPSRLAVGGEITLIELTRK